MEDNYCISKEVIDGLLEVNNNDLDNQSIVLDNIGRTNFHKALSKIPPKEIIIIITYYRAALRATKLKGNIEILEIVKNSGE